jgi:hypothetical protein
VKNELDILKDVAQRLDSLGIRYMLTGSFAMNYYAQPRMTRDIDLVVEVFMGNVGHLIRAFEPDYYVSSDAVLDSILHQSMFNLLHLESIVKVDCIVRKNEEFRKTEFNRRKNILIDGISIWIVTREDLILSKLYWAKDSNSELQLRDVKNLLTASLDIVYLDSWATELGVEPLWKQIRP